MNSPQIKDRLKVIRDKVEQGARLNLDDGIFLYEPDVSLHAIGELANWKREQINGNVGY
jgi:aminodeoxyfutalosine synthase